MTKKTDADSGVYINTATMLSLEAQAHDLRFVQKSASHRQLAGRLQSRMRGRGLSFEELREYLPGDDIRSIDWRVTARNRKPVVRVYSEEKERPVFILVDQRINMFFGSKQMMKSVTAAEAAMLCAWRLLKSGERVGGFVFGDDVIHEIRPQRTRNAVLAFASRIADQNKRLCADYPSTAQADMLNSVLDRVDLLAQHDCLIVVISDFDGHDDTTQHRLLHMANRNDVLCLLVYDPFLLNLPRHGALVVSGGRGQVELAFSQPSLRGAINEFARMRGRELLDWQQKLGLPMLPVSAAEKTAPQLRHLLMQSAWRQRRG